jgi:hypothetical protein
MLVRKEIEDNKLVDGGSKDNFRFSTYDVSIGQIIDPEGKPVTEYNLPPMGIVEVISKNCRFLPATAPSHT